MVLLTWVICEDQCNVCSENYVKDMNCCGDYDNTIFGIIRMRFCPVCGTMKPLIDADLDFVSNNIKRRVGVILATKYNKRFKEINRIVASFKNVIDKHAFSHLMSEHFRVPYKEVIEICNDVKREAIKNIRVNKKLD